MTAVGVASGLGPLEGPNSTLGIGQGRCYLKAARLQPWPAEAFLGMMKSGMKHADMAKMPGMPPQDKEVLTCAETGQALLETTQESWRGGLRGTAWDATLAARPWGFKLEEINMQVHQWHGEADRNVPVTMARYAAAKLPHCQAHFYPDEGHISLLAHHLEEVFSVLVG